MHGRMSDLFALARALLSGAALALVLAGCSAREPQGSGGLTSSPTALVSPAGGTVDNLYFAVTGDTRPANENDTAGYPSAVVETIFTDIAALRPTPSFVVSTGDYQFAGRRSPESAAQIGLYLKARARYPGVQFPAMGNHECTGATASNCGLWNKDGVTGNYAAFVGMMLGPIHQTLPYYAIHLDGGGGARGDAWTAKLVFVAANAWDNTQRAWLATALAVPTTYTFVIRHEPTEADTAPGTTPSEALILAYPLTLEICGHSHTHGHVGNRVIIGNGGAPLSGAGDYGFGVVQRRGDGAIVVDAIDYRTGSTDAAFHFVVTSEGALVD